MMISKEAQWISERTLLQCHCVQHQFHTGTPNIELEAQQWEAIHIHIIYRTAHKLAQNLLDTG